jgi:hypothetical protein
MHEAYYGCANLSNIAYIYSNEVTDVTNCFYGRDNTKTLYIYVPTTGNTLNTFLTNTASSIIGEPITWADYTSMGCYVNSDQRIYIMPVDDVAQKHHEDVNSTYTKIIIEEEAAFVENPTFTKEFPGLKMVSDPNYEYYVAWEPSEDYYHVIDNGDNTFVFDTDQTSWAGPMANQSRAWGTYVSLIFTYNASTNSTTISCDAGSLFLNPPGDLILLIKDKTNC